MSQEKAALYMLKGVVSEMEPDEQQKVDSALEKIRAVMSEYGQAGTIAMAMISLETAVDL